MKPRWKSVWMTPAASGAVAPALISQARVSFGPAVRKVCRPSARNPRPGELGQARLAHPGLGEQFRGLVFGQLGQVGLGLGVQEDGFGGRDQVGQTLAQVLVVQLGYVHVEHVKERLGCQQLELTQRGRIDARGRRPGPQRGAGVEELLGPGGSVVAWARAGSLANFASLASRGSAFSRVCRSARISSVTTVSMSRSGDTSPSTWLTSGSVNTRTTWQIASVSRMWAEELVAQPLALRGPADQPGDVDEAHRGRHDPGRVVQLGQLGQPRIGDPTMPTFGSMVANG